MNRYLVTGGAGFIGSNIVARLCADGHRVIVSDWLRQDERWRNLARHPVDDIVRPEALLAWLEAQGGALDAVIHMGAISATTETDVDAIVANNIRLTIDLWDWCAANDKPFIYASSAATYGDGAAGFVDDQSEQALARLLPLNAYGWSKHMLDRRIVARAAVGEPAPPQWVGLKFFNVYGPNEYHKGTMKSVIAHNALAIRDGAPMRLFKSYRPDYADGGQVRDFVYVRDCVDIICWFLRQPGRSGIFNIGTGEARSWVDLARAIFAALDKPEKIEFIDMPESLRGKYQYYTKAEMGKLRGIGYNGALTPIEEGVRDYVCNYLIADNPYL
jgi:ADP-L-glycero-D-manno-heptose 6-epimerase